MLSLLFECNFEDNHNSQMKILKNIEEKTDYSESMANMMN